MNNMYMEDVRDISLEVVKLIENRLNKFGIKMNDEQEDEIYNPVFNALEKISNGDYKNHN